MAHINGIGCLEKDIEAAIPDEQLLDLSQFPGAFPLEEVDIEGHDLIEFPGTFEVEEFGIVEGHPSMVQVTAVLLFGLFHHGSGAVDGMYASRFEFVGQLSGQDAGTASDFQNVVLWAWIDDFARPQMSFVYFSHDMDVRTFAKVHQMSKLRPL